MQHHVEITTSGTGGLIHVDGQDLTPTVTAARLEIVGGKEATLSLDLVASQVQFTGPANVIATVSEDDFKTRLADWLTEQAEDDTLEAAAMENSLDTDVTTAWINALLERARG